MTFTAADFARMQLESEIQYAAEKVKSARDSIDFNMRFLSQTAESEGRMPSSGDAMGMASRWLDLHTALTKMEGLKSAQALLQALKDGETA